MALYTPLRIMNQCNKNLCPEQLLAFEGLLSWSQEKFADLPWRSDRSFYKTLLSEVMLQQTTVATVVPKFSAFIEKYPSWPDLARAPLDDVLRLWTGLGYYQRARRLKALVESVTQDEFIANILNKKWLGVGPYTLNALLSIGLNRPYLAMDANLNRVFSRLQLSQADLSIQKLLQHYNPRDMNEALMDLGRMICKARSPKCELCFFKKICPSAGKVEDLPKKAKKPAIDLIRLIVRVDNSYLGWVKEKGFWLEGYIEFPTFLLTPQPGSLGRQYQVIGDYAEDFINLSKPLATIKSTITEYKFTNKFYEISFSSFEALLHSHNLVTTDYQVFNHKQRWSSLTLKALSAIELKTTV